MIWNFWRRPWAYATAIATPLMALALLVLLARRALYVFDLSWDSTSYHLPFAARIVGLCTKSCFEMNNGLEIYYESFPLATETIQGILWRVFGFPEAANFVSFISLLLLIIYLIRVWNVEFQWATFGLLAIPFVQIFATMSYIDLPTNVAASIGLLTLAGILLERPMPGLGVQMAFALSVIFLGNSKTQMIPIAGAIALMFPILVNRYVVPEARGIWRIDSRHWQGLLPSLALLLLVSAYGIRNFYVFANPFFPVNVTLGGVTIFPGVVPPASADYFPTYLKDTPGFVKWILSVLEYGAFDARPVPYTPGQGSVPQTATSFRMGGLFACYVLFNIGMLFFSFKRLETSKRRRITSFVSIMTIFVALLPASSEIRYYMFWMIVIVSLNLYFISAEREKNDLDNTLIYFSKLAIFSSLSFVILITSGMYLRARGGDIGSILSSMRVNDNVQKIIKNGDKVCYDNVRFAFLYAPVFHQGMKYKVFQYNSPQCNVIIP